MPRSQLPSYRRSSTLAVTTSRARKKKKRKTFPVGAVEFTAGQVVNRDYGSLRDGPNSPDFPHFYLSRHLPSEIFPRKNYFAGKVAGEDDKRNNSHSGVSFISIVPFHFPGDRPGREERYRKVHVTKFSIKSFPGYSCCLPSFLPLSRALHASTILISFWNIYFSA